jgi:anti-sigma factor RsiW
MAGDEWQAKLDPYLDGELPPGEMRGVDEHLRTCASCSADILNRVQVRRVIKTAGQRYTPRPEFRQQMERRFAGRSRVAFPWRWAFAGAFAVVVIALGFYFSREQGMLQREHTYSELVDLHVSTLASSTPVDVVSSDRHTVKPWFQGKIPFTFNLPELNGSDFTLVGGRLTYLAQAPGAQVIYRIRKHDVSMFIFQERALGKNLQASTPVERKASFNMETWSKGGLRYFVLGDVAAQDVAKLAQLFKSADQTQ